jgi:predicted PurR-regulated permease PerM
MIIPAIIVGIVALITNLPGNMVKASQEVAANSANVTAIANSTAPVAANISEATAATFVSSMAVTAIVGLILVIIFAFFLTMGQSRLANTGSLGEALNIPEAARDISRIGVGKVIAVVLLIIVVIGVIQAVLGYVYGQVPQLSLLSIIVTPYLAFFSQRAYGLLYSDIA